MIIKNKYKLINLDLNHLMDEASLIRKERWGNQVTYSRKVFAPLTNMCRNTCGYCSFVKSPDSSEANIMNPEAVLKTALEGEKSGCKEILFSLGEKPELRYDKAKKGLQSLGYNSLIEYLRDSCKLVLQNTSLLPHLNVGTMTNSEIDLLNPFSASMGMMLESTSALLNSKGYAHYACPDKVPLQRIRTLERAGEKKVPFTTGILIGIGESWEDRIDSLELINKLNNTYGNIQEVIIQNFQQKPNISMSNHPEPLHQDILRTISIARIILDPDISIQAPPNLSLNYIDYLKAGINDWGGISPVTIDYINPSHEWPVIKKLRVLCKDSGFKLQERLTIYPNFLKERNKYISKKLKTNLNYLVRSDGLAENQIN